MNNNNNNNDETRKKEEIRKNEEESESTGNQTNDLNDLIREVTDSVRLHREKMQEENETRKSTWSHNCDDGWLCDCENVTNELTLNYEEDCQFADSFKEEMV